MTEARPRLILFDCDGTLADSCGLICEAMRRMFVAHELPEPADEASRGVIGLSLDKAIHRLHPTCAPEALSGMVEAYREIFRQTRNEPEFAEALFPGTLAVLERLHRRDDVLLGLVTGKTRRGVRSIFEAHGLARFFVAQRTADDCLSKPHPAMVLECCEESGIAPRDTIVVGDAVFDMEMARAAGAAALGVAWGANAPAALLATGAAAVVSDMRELGDYLDRWLAGEAPTVSDLQHDVTRIAASPSELAERLPEPQIR